MSLEVNARLSQIARHEGVQGVLVISYDGIVIKSYNIMDEETINHYAYISLQLAKKAKETINDFAEAELEVLRMKSGEMEYVLSVEHDYVLLAIYKQTKL